MNKHIVFGKSSAKKKLLVLNKSSKLLTMSSMAALLASCSLESVLELAAAVGAAGAGTTTATTETENISPTTSDDAFTVTAAKLANLTLDGLAGTDTLTITDSLGTFDFSTAGTKGANLDNVENIVFGNGENVITGLSSAVKNVTGGAGADNITVTGMATGGAISLGAGADTLTALTKTFIETSGASLKGGDGTDTLIVLRLGEGDGTTQNVGESLSLSNVSGFEVLTIAESFDNNHTITLSDGINTVNVSPDNSSEVYILDATIAQAEALTTLVNITGTGQLYVKMNEAGNIDLTGLTTLTNFLTFQLADGTNNLTVNSSDADKFVHKDFHLIGGTGADTLTVKGVLADDGDIGYASNFETIVLDSGADGVTLTNNNVNSGKILTIDATGKTGALTFDGSAELDGTFAILASNFGDTITTGFGADTITGGTGADTIKWTASTATEMATETGAAKGVDNDFDAGTKGDLIKSFVSGSDKLSFAAAAVTNVAGTETDALKTIAAAGTVANTDRFVEITTAQSDGEMGTAITLLDGLTTSAVAIGDSFIAFINDGSNGYLYLVEQISTADTIAAQDVTLIGQLNGVTNIADGDLFSF